MYLATLNTPINLGVKHLKNSVRSSSILPHLYQIDSMERTKSTTLVLGEQEPGYVLLTLIPKLTPNTMNFGYHWFTSVNTKTPCSCWKPGVPFHQCSDQLNKALASP